MRFMGLHSPAAHKRRKQNRLRVVALCAAAGLAVSLGGFAARCQGIRKAVLRLHVLANSNSEEDQRVKLLVRDALLQAGAEFFGGSSDLLAAEAALAPHLPSLEAVAQDVLQREGKPYGVRVELGDVWFNTRVYEDQGITLPAGTYRAVRVLLGAGQGRNWWCVMFPPLCLPAAQSHSAPALDMVLTAGQMRLVQSNPKYEIRFKVIELLSWLFLQCR